MNDSSRVDVSESALGGGWKVVKVFRHTESPLVVTVTRNETHGVMPHYSLALGKELHGKTHAFIQIKVVNKRPVELEYDYVAIASDLLLEASEYITKQVELDVQLKKAAK